MPLDQLLGLAFLLLLAAVLCAAKCRDCGHRQLSHYRTPFGIRLCRGCHDRCPRIQAGRGASKW